MKKIICFSLLLSSMLATAQNSSESDVKQTIESFFKAFHAQDSVSLNKAVHTKIVLQTIGTSESGQPLLKSENYRDFIKSIVSIPDSVHFEERIVDYSIQIDGPMANAWTTYEFWLNEEFHHCGVNSFQLLKDNDAWKIIYLIDTRRVEDCKPSTH